jgi:hypothetical protein
MSFESKVAGAKRIWDRTDRNTHRMAGGALAAMIAPSVMTTFDDRDAPWLQEQAAGLITTGGITAGMLLGELESRLTSEQMDIYVRSEIDKLKRKSKTNMKEHGPQYAADQFGRQKQRLMEDVTEPLKFGIPTIDYFGHSPRQYRHMAAGAMLGGLASIIPSYLVQRGDKIE